MVRSGSVQATIVKARCGGDVRKLSVHHSDDISYNDLLLMMQRIFKLEPSTNVALKYKDQEGDYVTLADDNDLLLALQTEPSLSLIVLCDAVNDKKITKLQRELQVIRDTAIDLLETLKVTENLVSPMPKKDDITTDHSIENLPKSADSVATIQPSLHEQVNNSTIAANFSPSMFVKEEQQQQPLKSDEHDEILMDGSLIQSQKMLDSMKMQTMDNSYTSREGSHSEPRTEIDISSNPQKMAQSKPSYAPPQETGDRTTPVQFAGHQSQPVPPFAQSTAQCMPHVGIAQMAQQTAPANIYAQQYQQPQLLPQQQQQQQQQQPQQFSQTVTPTVPQNENRFGVSQVTPLPNPYNPAANIPELQARQQQQPMTPPSITPASAVFGSYATSQAPPSSVGGMPQTATSFGGGVQSAPPPNMPYSTVNQMPPPPPSSMPPASIGPGRNSPASLPPTGLPPTMFGQMAGGVNPFARGTHTSHHMRFHPPQ